MAKKKLNFNRTEFDAVKPAQAKGYSEAGASRTKKTMVRFRPQSGSAQEDIDFNNLELRQRSRILMMSTPVITSAIKTIRTNAIGQGLQLQSMIDREILGMSEEEAQAWQKNTEREFKMWASSKRNCDAIGVNNFYELQQLIMTSYLASGDVFALVKHAKTSRSQPYSLRLHVIEADRISTPWQDMKVVGTVTTGRTPDGRYIFDGVEVDRSGLPVAYHICNQYPYETGKYEAKEWTRVPAIQSRTGLPNVLQVTSSERPDQYRGVPFIAPVVEIALQLRRYTEHEVNAAQIESSMSGFITTGADPTDIPINSTVDDEDEYDTGDDVTIDPGTFVHLKDGESVTTITPARPAGGFTSFTDTIAKQIGAALEIPKELMLKSFEASYSASRAALLEGWKSMMVHRSKVITQFADPVYELFLTEAIARGRIHAPGFFSDPAIKAAYLKCNWIGPSQGQLDPVKEITAEILACSEGFTSHKAATTKLNGSDWDANMAELGIETKKITEIGGSPDPHQSKGGNEGDQQEKEVDAKAIDKILNVLNLLDKLDRKEEEGNAQKDNG